MNFGWIKVNGYSYLGTIHDVDMQAKTCSIELDNDVFTEVPFSEVGAPYMHTLPWEEQFSNLKEHLSNKMSMP